MSLSRTTALRILLVGLVLGVLTDILTRQNILGLNFLLFTVIWAGLCMLANVGRGHSLRLPVVFTVLAVLNAFLVFWRAAPLVQFWSLVITLASLALLAMTAFTENFLDVPLSSRVPAFFGRFTRTATAAPNDLVRALSQSKRAELQVSRGVLGAIGLAFVFILLFASADQVVGKSFSWLGNVLEWLGTTLQNYDVARLITIVFWTALSVTMLLLLLRRKKADLPSPALQIRRSLTGRDARTIFWTLLPIFAVFVLLQLRYLFLGGSLPSGLTYATYARQGYGQLLVATLLASAVVKYVVTALKNGADSQRTRVLATILVVLNSIVILSAWKRLSLYEATYGWTLTRFVARLGLVCILLGSVALVAWLWGKLTSRQLYATGWYVIVAVLMTAAVLNPEAIIARKNITERPSRTVGIDSDYVASLSADAWPAICATAPALQAAYPREYRNLKSRSFTNALPDYRPVENHGLARHHTRSHAYTQTYQNCL